MNRLRHKGKTRRFREWAGLRPTTKIGAWRGSMGEGGLWLGEKFNPKWEAPDVGMVVRTIAHDGLAANYPGLEQLVRSRFDKKHVRFNTSIDRPLSFVAEVLRAHGHPWMRDVFSRVLVFCHSVLNTPFGKKATAENRGDDLVRKTLAVLEDSIAATSPVAKVMFSGMSTLGGPRCWDRDSVIASVRSWVTGEATLFSREVTDALLH